MKLPTTRQECIEKYNLRRQMHIPLTKLDMYLGGMICCSEEEFLYRKPMSGGYIISGEDCLCKLKCERDKCRVTKCSIATDATLRIPWDAPLYEDKRHE